MKMNKNTPKKAFLENDSNKQSVESKFKLISCPRDGKNCKNHLNSINKNYLESDIHFQNKEYLESINALNSAFTKTFELNKETCEQCAKTFRYTIIQTLQSIHSELYDMSNGLFKTNRYKSSYIFAGNILNNLRKQGD